MKINALFLIVCSVLFFACRPQNTSSGSKAPAHSEKNKDQIQLPAKPSESSNQAPNNSLGQTNPQTVEDEQATPPQPLTGIFLTCVKPTVENAVMNIDCTLQDVVKKRVKVSDIADKVVYSVDSAEKDDDVLISSVEGSATAPYDVRYQVKAKDITKIKKIVDSSIFFAKAFGPDGKEIKDAIKPFFGFNLDFPSVEEIKQMFKDFITDRLPF